MNADQYRRFKALWFLRLVLALVVTGATFRNPLPVWAYVAIGFATGMVSNGLVNGFIAMCIEKQAQENRDRSTING